MINAPNIAGLGCNYVEQGQLLINSAWAGLPNFMSSYFATPSAVAITYSVAGGQISFAQACPFAQGSLPSVLWNFGDPGSGIANTSTLTSPSHFYSNTGTYNLSLILYYPCRTDTIIQTIIITDVTDYTGLQQNHLQDGDIKVFPNPAQELLRIEAPSGKLSDGFTAEIRSALGVRVLFASTVNSSLELDLKTLKNGLYFLSVTNDNKYIITKKFVKS